MPLLRLSRSGHDHAVRRLASECPIAVSLCGIGYAVMMASPSDLEDFAVGFARSERLIERADEVTSIKVRSTDEGMLLDIELVPCRRDGVFERVRHRVGESSCGLCGIENLEQALRPLPKVGRPAAVTPDQLFDALYIMRRHQTLNAETGAVHAAAWFDETGEFRTLREDIGRHNAMDKLIGQGLRTGADLRSGFALLSARCSYELIEKAALAQIPMLITISAPTSLAVDRARSAGLTLVALARSDSMLVMNDPHGRFTGQAPLVG